MNRAGRGQPAVYVEVKGGLDWQLSVMRTFSGKIIASAVEGESKHEAGYSTFMCGWDARRIGIELVAKRLTDKVRAVGMEALREAVAAQIAADAAVTE
jgi:hypothetical protein